VLEFDKEKRQLKLSMKQLVPTGLDDYIAEHAEGDLVSGRLIDISAEHGTVELGEGIRARGLLVVEAAAPEQVKSGASDLSSFSSMLAARWKNGPSASEAKAEPVRVGQIRRFRIALLDRDAKKIEVQLI
jgi:small subunit ribosomal protein S1